MIKELENRLKKIEDLLQERHHNDVIYLNIEETSEFIKMKISSIYQLKYQGKIPYYKRGKLLLFKKSEIVNWIESKRKGTAEELASKVNLDKIVEKYKGKDNGLWKLKK